MTETVDVVQILTLAGVAIAILSNIANLIRIRKESQKEHDQRLIWQTETTASIKELSKRVDSHNNYAKMFAECTEDIAYIKGRMEK